MEVRCRRESENTGKSAQKRSHSQANVLRWNHALSDTSYTLFSSEFNDVQETAPNGCRLRVFLKQLIAWFVLWLNSERLIFPCRDIRHVLLTSVMSNCRPSAFSAPIFPHRATSFLPPDNELKHCSQKARKTPIITDIVPRRMWDEPSLLTSEPHITSDTPT